VPKPDPAELRRFAESFLYGPEACLVDEVTELLPEARAIRARLETTRRLAYASLQRTSALHPAHVAGADLIAATGTLGCLHAWFFHGCRWDAGWSAFGNRIHRADFKRLARLGPPLELECRELRARVGPKRIVIRFEFRFHQDGQLVYFGDQTAMFLKDVPLGAEGAGDE
jgi:hypothetical protein